MRIEAKMTNLCHCPIIEDLTVLFSALNNKQTSQKEMALLKIAILNVSENKDIANKAT